VFIELLSFSFITGLVIDGPYLTAAVFEHFLNLLGTEHIKGTIHFLEVRTWSSLTHRYDGTLKPFPSWSFRDFLHAVATDHCTLIGLRIRIPKMAEKGFWEVVTRFRVAFLELILGADARVNCLEEFVKSILQNYAIGSYLNRGAYTTDLLDHKQALVITGKDVSAFLQGIIDQVLSRNNNVQQIAAHKAVMRARVRADLDEQIAAKLADPTKKIVRKRKRQLAAEDVQEPAVP